MKKIGLGVVFFICCFTNSAFCQNIEEQKYSKEDESFVEMGKSSKDVNDEERRNLSNSDIVEADSEKPESSKSINLGGSRSKRRGMFYQMPPEGFNNKGYAEYMASEKSSSKNDDDR